MLLLSFCSLDELSWLTSAGTPLFYCLHLVARIVFNISIFSILSPMISSPSTSTDSFDILIHILQEHGICQLSILLSILPTSELCSIHQQLYQYPSTPTSSPTSSMSTYPERLASFAAWSHASPSPKDLAKSGLSYRPTNKLRDDVICNRHNNCLCD